MELRELEDREGVNEAYEIVGEYEFWIEGLDRPLKIKVRKGADGKFWGICNLEVKGSAAADFYISLSPRDTIESAVNDGLGGFLMFYSEDAKVREYGAY